MRILFAAVLRRGAPRLTTALAPVSALIALVACFSGHDSKRDPTGHPWRAGRVTRSAAQERCATTPTPITAQGIAPVLIGARISAVANACETRDSAITLGESLAERAHSVDVAGGTVIAVSTGTADTTITRIIVRDPRLLTAKGIHVGSTVGALRAAHGKLCASVGEGNVVAFAADVPGIAFETDVPPAELHGGAAAVEKDASLIPDAATISGIRVTGVPAACLAR
jgi:hypothetical protein